MRILIVNNTNIMTSTVDNSNVTHTNTLNNISTDNNPFENETVKMKKKYVGLLIMLTPIFTKSNQKIQEYASELGKLLLNIINVHNDDVLEELHSAFEQLLLFYMQDITQLKENTLNIQVYDHRHQNLSEINRCVKKLSLYPDEDKIQQLKTIILSVV